MLAVFEKSIGKGPEELTSPTSKHNDSIKNGMEIVNSFVSSRSLIISTRFEGVGASIAYTHEGETLLQPRLFASVEDMFCIFVGTLENLCVLRRQYGLSKSTTEALLVIEAYRTLRDRGPYPADQVVKDFSGRFAFVVFDSKSSTVFAAVDGECSVPLFWGTAVDGSLVFCDDPGILEDGCGKSFAPFPAGGIWSIYLVCSSGLNSSSFFEPMVDVSFQIRPFCALSFQILLSALYHIRKPASLPSFLSGSQQKALFYNPALRFSINFSSHLKTAAFLFCPAGPVLSPSSLSSTMGRDEETTEIIFHKTNTLTN